jgi:hypothetical protein
MFDHDLLDKLSELIDHRHDLEPVPLANASDTLRLLGWGHEPLTFALPNPRDTHHANSPPRGGLRSGTRRRTRTGLHAHQRLG